MLSRLENMILMGVEIPLTAIRQQIASGIDIMIHLGRLRDGSRKVLEIVEVMGCKEDSIVLKPLYRFAETGTDKEGRICGNLRKEGELSYVEKLQYAGLWNISV